MKRGRRHPVRAGTRYGLGTQVRLWIPVRAGTALLAVVGYQLSQRAGEWFVNHAAFFLVLGASACVCEFIHAITLQKLLPRPARPRV